MVIHTLFHRFSSKPAFRTLSLTTVLITALLAAIPAYAHFPWINLEDAAIDTGKHLTWTIGWGHRFPMAGFMKGEEVENMIVLGPGGAKTSATSLSELQFQSPEALAQPGAYIVAVTRKGGFYTKTTEGGKRQSKKGLENALRCSRSNSGMKAIANVGGADGKVDLVAGHPMEIVPLANPAGLRVGDFLPFQVLLKGKPYNGDFLATYAGFSTEQNVFAYAARTDKNGMGKVKILAAGAWLIKVDYEEPYADPSECDVESFGATCTFEVP